MTLWAHHQVKKASRSLWPGVGLSRAPGVGESATTLFLTFCFWYFGQKTPGGWERGGAGGPSRGRGPPHPPTPGLEREVAEAPAPTFLHQLLVGEGATHNQQHRQEHEGQDDARHGARAQARRVRILAWGEAEGSAQFHPVGVESAHSEGRGCPAPPRHSAARVEGGHPAAVPPPSPGFRAARSSVPFSL